MSGATTSFSRRLRSRMPLDGPTPSTSSGRAPVIVRLYIHRTYSAARMMPAVATAAATWYRWKVRRHEELGEEGAETRQRQRRQTRDEEDTGRDGVTRCHPP